MHKKFEINGTKIMGGCQSGRKVLTHNSKIYFPFLGRGKDGKSSGAAFIESQVSVFTH